MTSQERPGTAAEGAPLHIDTRIVHPGVTVDGSSRPAAVPLYQTSMFVFDDLKVFTDAWGRPDGPSAYSRLGNPTIGALERTLADLEGGAGALAAASGMGAINAVLHGLLRTGDHILVQKGVYGGTIALLNDLSERWGLRVTHVPLDRPGAIEEAVRPETRMLYLETIANPMGRVCDLPACAAAARAAGLLTVVDNTFATPILCRPLEHGADIVVHSTTKYLAGHSDVVGGAAVFADPDLHREVWGRAIEYGASCDPFAAWLTLRGVHTLSLRMPRHCENAARLARRLAEHPKVRKVHYAGMPDHPDHATAAGHLGGFGGVLAFDIDGGLEAVRTLTGALELVSLAPSLGGIFTTVLHPASTSHASLTPGELREAGIGEGTVRIATGLEQADDLWRDFEQALDRI